MIGDLRPTWDLWGATVNLAARLESRAPHNGVLVSEEFQAALPDHWHPTATHSVELKGIGMCSAYSYVPEPVQRRRRSTFSTTGLVDRALAVREADREMRRSGLIDLSTGVLNEQGAHAALAMLRERDDADLVWVALRPVLDAGNLDAGALDPTTATIVAQEVRALFRADDVVARVGTIIWAVAVVSNGLTADNVVERLCRRLTVRSDKSEASLGRMQIVSGTLMAGANWEGILLQDALPDTDGEVVVGAEHPLSRVMSRRVMWPRGNSAEIT